MSKRKRKRIPGFLLAAGLILLSAGCDSEHVEQGENAPPVISEEESSETMENAADQRAAITLTHEILKLEDGLEAV